ncbi:CDP-diacylglycerol--inositol 3-phosphatidyltransferase [Corynebacterium kalinowskii]|uniref:Phosphatidylinositol phosphate synthase n=1 Tax=Corynebacterium kalinowskii TaxID=2675216 RepID=A0A6B8VL33_9CORY|nr:CDP-alcohol phosphatidyltransferase family protein [Corynebacterium kalinowskii]QGU02154.1 CDP-diacylglycerol--inositol 3-phosphatidyltransferase [Corynebacterium kalinowskii]
MLSVRGRRPAAVVVEPVAKACLRLGLTPNIVTVIGTVIACGIILILVPLGELFWAAVLSALFTAFDLVDGTMARLRGGGTSFGATLDATCDRITDGVLFSVITWWLIYRYDANVWLVGAAFSVLVSSQVISYVKARAEASGISVVGGLVERAERLILGLLGLGLTGLGVPFAIDTAIWILAVGSVLTVIQRLVMAARNERANDPIAPPPGAEPARP